MFSGAMRHMKTIQQVFLKIEVFIDFALFFEASELFEFGESDIFDAIRWEATPLLKLV